MKVFFYFQQPFEYKTIDELLNMHIIYTYSVDPDRFTAPQVSPKIKTQNQEMNHMTLAQKYLLGKATCFEGDGRLVKPAAPIRPFQNVKARKSRRGHNAHIGIAQ
jgi:hypothetical protein